MNRAFGQSRNKNKRIGQKLRARADRYEMDTRSYHSSSYHRYFEGYHEYYTVDLKGRKKLIREYKGEIYTQQIPLKVSMCIKLLFMLLFLLLVILLVSTGNMDRVSDHAWYMAIAELVTILMMSATGYTLLIDYLFAPKRMTIGEYKMCHISLQRRARICALSFGIDTIFTIGFALLHLEMVSEMDWIAAMCFGAGMLIAMAMSEIEKKIPYQTEENHEPQVTESCFEL